MKNPTALIISLLAALVVVFAGMLLTSCAGLAPIATPATTYGIGKVLENSTPSKRAARVEKLRSLADGLDTLAQGSVTRAAVQALLARHIAGDADLQFLAAVVLAYFPAEEIPVHHDAKLSAAARSLASSIRAALPPPPDK